MSEELKPCPFCGGEARMHVAFASGGDHSVGVYVECLECRSWSGTKWGDGAQEKAAEAWNRRANDCDREELLALADELEGMDCRTCPADGTKDCRDLPCEEAVARAASRRIREVVEHDACEDATVSAYDLLPEEDRKALAWVREHGGLDAVEKRLMPEGMEWLLDVWPKWSNGEYCKFGDWWKAGKYGEREPQQLSRLAFFTPEQLREWGQDEGENFGYEWDYMRPSDTTYRPDKVEPPAPKVLDADGVEIRVGDTVYVLGFGEPLTVKGFTDDGRVLMSFHGENSLGYKPSKLTHEQPEPPDSRQAVVNEIGDEMAARIDLLVSSGRWSDAD